MNNITNLASPSSFPLGNENEGSHCSRLIKTFNHEQFGQIRTLTMPDGQIGFVGKDVADALGYKLPRKAIMDHVDNEDKTTVPFQNAGSNYKTQVVLINESGLYSLILSSKLPQAKQFKHWVTSVVLPQIRKTGGYIPVNEEDDEKTILCKALNIMQKTIEKKDAIIEAQRPKVQFANAITASKDSILIRDLAKLLTQNGFEIGQNRLFAWLRKHGYLFQNETRPIQKWVEKGIFDYDVRAIENGRHIIESITTKVTGKGQEYFINGFLSGKMSLNQ